MRKFICIIKRALLFSYRSAERAPLSRARSPPSRNSTIFRGVLLVSSFVYGSAGVTAAINSEREREGRRKRTPAAVNRSIDLETREAREILRIQRRGRTQFAMLIIEIQRRVAVEETRARAARGHQYSPHIFDRSPSNVYHRYRYTSTCSRFIDCAN